MDHDEVKSELAWAIGKTFLRGLHFKGENGNWTHPRDIYDALENRRGIMQNYAWDTDEIEKKNPGLLRANDLWEDTDEGRYSEFDFGSYPTVPRWVERFGGVAGDWFDEEYVLKEIFGDLFSEDPADKMRVLEFLDLEPPEIG